MFKSWTHVGPRELASSLGVGFELGLARARAILRALARHVVVARDDETTGRGNKEHNEDDESASTVILYLLLLGFLFVTDDDWFASGHWIRDSIVSLGLSVEVRKVLVGPGLDQIDLLICDWENRLGYVESNTISATRFPHGTEVKPSIREVDCLHQIFNRVTEFGSWDWSLKSGASSLEYFISRSLQFLIDLGILIE